MEKIAPSDHPILPLIAQRWSPRSFADKPVDRQTLASLFEAARWAASCFNDQPWSFIVASHDQPEAYQQLLDCLVPFNVTWAQRAPVLVATVARQVFQHNGTPNGWGEYDCGQAAATLTLQATSMGLIVHQMGGFDPDKLISTFHLPEHYRPISIIAIGYAGQITHLPLDLQEKELAPRSRNPLSAFVFSETWGQPASFTVT